MADVEEPPLTADEQFLEEGVPSFEEPFIQKYLDGRDQLIAQEKRQRSDHAFRETFSPMAREAAAIVSAIRFEEQQTLWNAEYEDNLAKEEGVALYPGMMFSLARKRMESSKLWRIIKKMPKGALLHCHMQATADLDMLINDTINTERMCIVADAPLASEEARTNIPFQFSYVKGMSPSQDVDVWAEKYAGKVPVLVSKAAESFPDGGKEGYIHWIKSRATITETESLQHHLGVDHVWKRFMACFPILGSMMNYEPIFRKFLRTFFTQLAEDGVRWVDIRSVFVTPYTRAGADKPDDDHENQLAAIQEEIEAFKQTEAGRGFWGARLIWTSMRAWDSRPLVEDMKRCIEMKRVFPDLIAGYDCVGQEDAGRPLAEMTPELFWFKKRCVEEGVDIPFYFHAGECLGDGNTTDENLFDAVLLGTRRIGHGFSLYKHPLLIDMVKEKKILIESCPVSNEILRLTSSILSHPLPALLARGVACALCNDDPTIFGLGSSGMTHDFWQALQGWENLGLEGLASLAENSVRWATFDDVSAKEWQAEVKAGAFGSGQRAKRLKEWSQEFEKFCQWVVLEFGPEHEINTLD